MSADKDATPTHETDFAALWSSDGVTRSLAATGAALPADLPFLFTSGQRFGSYAIVRPLGKGGMGQVYEAEETDSGRRVAIKLLSRGLGDDEERQRFLREGQLAASLSHPNCVYVFGTSEVQGFPVIAMELAPAGTLKDLVDPAAPMAAATAVDATLQVIAGLEAAAAIGILHRDVKPSNCFMDRDGRVMIGDFGLSIAASGAAAERGILGTPGFASPEQLRGAPLDVRSDIYSVGATLYYLLTGRTPFDASDLPSMLTKLEGETAPALTIARRDLPGRFGSVVAKCLAARPADRYGSYAALRAALEPFRTTTMVPAPLARRFLAGFIDSMAASLPMIPVNLLLGPQILELEREGHALLLALPPVLGSLLYFALFEGTFGCAAGKAAVNVRVVDHTGHPPGITRAFGRALAFTVPTQIIIQGVSYAFLRTFVTAATSADPAAAATAGQLVLLMTFVSLALLFLPARRRNGFAAFHDRVSRTRVVVAGKAIEARDAARARTAMPETGPAGTGRIGPYRVTDDVLEAASRVTAPTVVDGYDDRLRRRVWIELLPPDSPAVPPWRRDLNRPGRVRWISGRRAATECWDAYERIDGRTLADATASPQPWSRVRHWVADLAREIAAASRDGSTAPLRHDRVWIADDDRARLLDWTPRPEPGASASESSPQQFLYGLAAGALTGRSPGDAVAEPRGTPLPGSVNTLLTSLSAGTAGTLDAIAQRSESLLRDAATFPRRRRLLQLTACAAIPIVMVVSVFSVLRMQLRARNADPQAFALKACLNRLASIDRKNAAALTAPDREQRELLEIYIAARLRAQAEETASYARAFPALANVQKDYRLAARALENHPRPSEEQARRAEAVVERVIAANVASLEGLNRPLSMAGVLGLIAGGSIAFVAMLGVIGAVLTGSGFTLRGFGAMLVTRNGIPISRWRAVGRALITWSPLVLWFVIMSVGARAENTTVSVAASYAFFVSIFTAGALYAWRHPARGIQDRIAGTWIVPK